MEFKHRKRRIILKYSYFLQRNRENSGDSVKSKLKEYLSEDAYNTVHAAMAYVTVAGVRDMLNTMQTEPIFSRWVIGLDDAISQPGAIDLVGSFSGSIVRVASFEEHNFRFHPKILYFKHSGDLTQALMMLGSVNLTRKAFSDNIESAVFLCSESSDDTKELDVFWNSAWSTGSDFSDEYLQSYRDKFELSKKLRNRARKERRKISGKEAFPKPRKVLDNDQAEIDPSRANTCWIECGNVTAKGRELEFKAEQALYFGLNQNEEESRYFTFMLSNGKEVSLCMRFQENHMWRLQMNNDVPEVAHGLRPTLENGSLGRSEFVAVFNRIENSSMFDLSFIKLGSKDFDLLREKSLDHGTLGSTTAREYGWF